MKGMIVVHIEKCVACKSCELACAVEHSASKELYTAMAENPAPRARVTVEQGAHYAVPLQCRQCDDAPCARVCPSGALSVPDDDSPVVIEQDLCIGCRWCVQTCPFGVISIDEKSRAVIKCDMCMERLKRGESPACVNACPTHALELQTLDEVSVGKRRAALLQIERGLEDAARRVKGGE